MSIFKAGKILINGSTNAFGGYVYSANFNHEYGNTPSSVSISIISKSKEYLPVKLSATVPYTIAFGTELILKMYAVSYNIEDGTGGRILKVEFIDGRFIMNRYWVTLADFPCTSPYFIKLGIQYTPSENQLAPVPTANNNAITIPLPVLSPASDGVQSFLSYSYNELQSKSTGIKLPSIPNEVPFYRLNEEGPLGEIFSQFCRAYGFTWYWDYDNNTPILLDLRTDVDLDSTLPTRLKNTPCFKNLTYGESIRDLEAQGGVFYNNANASGNQDWSIVAVKNIFGPENKNFFGYTIYDDETLQLAIMATWGQDVYESYLFNKYDFYSAITAQGFTPVDDAVAINSDGNQTRRPLPGGQVDTLSTLTDVQLNALHAKLFTDKGKVVPDFFDKSVRVIRAVRTNEHNSIQDSHFQMADVLKSKQIGWFTSPLTVSSSTFQLTLVDPTTILSNIPGIGVFIKDPNNPDLNFQLTQFNGDKIPVQLKDVTTDNLYIVSFPKLKFAYDSFGAQSPSQALLQSIDPTTNQLYVRQLTDGQQLFPGSLPSDVFFIIWGYKDANPPTPTVSEGLLGYLSLETPTVGAGNSGQLSQSYTSKYKDLICYVPVLNDLVLSFKMISLANEAVLNPRAAISNTVILPTKTAKTFSVDVYGIDTGLNLHPNKGLDSFRIVMGEEGYESNYSLSSKKRIPLDNKIARIIYL